MQPNAQPDYTLELSAWGASSVVALVAEIPWVPLITLVLIPLARWVAEHLSAKRELADLRREVARLHALLPVPQPPSVERLDGR